MDSLQMECILQCDEALHNNVIGIFAIDELTQKLANIMEEEAVKPGYKSVGIIINTDRSQEKGTHWVCMVYEIKPSNKPIVEIFDSLGNDSPLRPKEHAIMRFVGYLFRSREKKNKKKKPALIRNNNAVQTKRSKTCGYWVIYFLHLRLRSCCGQRNSLRGFLERFARPRPALDEYVRRYITRRYPLCLRRKRYMSFRV